MTAPIKLSRDERSAIFAQIRAQQTTEQRSMFSGSFERTEKPDIKAGDTFVLSWTRGGRQIVDYTTGQTVEIPRRPSIWLKFREPVIRDGKWLVSFEGHDEREPVRILAPVPGPHSQAGLKTRWRPKDKVPKRGEEKESWTPDTERGYGGRLRSAIDDGVGVDDETLKRFATEGRDNLRQHRADVAKESEGEQRRQREQAIMRRLRLVLTGLDPTAQIALLATIEQQISSASIDTSDLAA